MGLAGGFWQDRREYGRDRGRFYRVYFSLPESVVAGIAALYDHQAATAVVEACPRNQQPGAGGGASSRPAEELRQLFLEKSGSLPDCSLCREPWRSQVARNPRRSALSLFGIACAYMIGDSGLL